MSIYILFIFKLDSEDSTKIRGQLMLLSVYAIKVSYVHGDIELFTPVE